MKGDHIVSFLIGMFAFIILSAIAATAGTILLDMNSITSFSLGSGVLMVYRFTGGESGFSFEMGYGILLVGFAGGLLTLALKAITKKYIVLE